MADGQKIARRCSFLGLGALAGCGGGASQGSGYHWGWYIFDPLQDKGQSNLQFLVGGVWATLSVSLCAIVLSVVLGSLVAFAGLSPRRWLNGINRVYVELFRSVPLLVLLLWVFYGLPVIIGLQLGLFATGVLAMAISDSAFEAEVFRAGIQSVPKGQIEAAKALGITWYLQMRLIVLPQAIKVILPALGNQFVYVLKASSLISVIGLPELTRRANELNVSEYRPLEIYTLLVAEYLLLILVVSWLVRKLERRMSTSH